VSRRLLALIVENRQRVASFKAQDITQMVELFGIGNDDLRIIKIGFWTKEAVHNEMSELLSGW